MDNTTILQHIWSLSKGDWVFLPYMHAGSWTEGGAVKKEDAVVLPVSAAYADTYFTPLSFISPQRRKGMLGDPGVIFADLDSEESLARAREVDMHPSLLVHTSAHHYHGYWFLDQPVPPTTWEPAARAWSQDLGADPGGWDSTQVLRLPHSRNHKFSPPHIVTPVYFQPELVYSIHDFPSGEAAITTASADPAPVPSKRERDYLVKAGIEDDRLPLSARYWLTAGAWEIEALGDIDRSKIMWGVEKHLLANGYTVYEVFQLLHFSAINKWFARPDKLWLEVNKAAGA